MVSNKRGLESTIFKALGKYLNFYLISRICILIAYIELECAINWLWVWKELFDIETSLSENGLKLRDDSLTWQHISIS